MQSFYGHYTSQPVLYPQIITIVLEQILTVKHIRIMEKKL